LLAENPENGDIVHAVAVLSVQLNDTSEAEKQFRHLVGMNHRESDAARLYLGGIAEKDNRPDEALRWPPIKRSVVVLPPPEIPMIATTLPRGIFILIPVKIGRRS
jgi:hypothetical protein